MEMQRPELVDRWEAAYRSYGEASEHAARTVAGDPEAAEGVAAASWQVATMWREIGASQELPWWVLASLRAAAEAFEQQSRDWHARAVRFRAQPLIVERGRGRPNPTGPTRRAGNG